MIAEVQPEVTVRTATEEDLLGVLDLERTWATERITPNPLELGSVEGFRKHSIVLVADNRARLVGYATADMHVSDGAVPGLGSRIPAGHQYMEVEDMYVLPGWRGKGIGGGLLKSLLQRAEMDGVIEIALTAVHLDPARLVRFYELHGFRDVTTSSRFGERRMLRGSV